MNFIEAKTVQDFTDLRLLFREYFIDIDDEIAYKDARNELNLLEEIYNNKESFFILVKCTSNNLIGCGGLKKLDTNRCELKRIYVRPAFRGQGIAKKIMNIVIDKAKMYNYKEIVLATKPILKSAINMYYSFGFRNIAPYYDTSYLDDLHLMLEL